MMFDICADDFQFSTPYAFYSPDSLRAIFWSVRSHPNASYRKTFNDYSQYPNMCNSNLTYVHDMECLVGYRSNLDQVWQLRSLFAYHAGCSPNVDELAVFFYNYFFMQYKNEAISVDAIKLNDPFGGAVVPINEYYIDHPDRYTPEKFRWKYIGYNLGDADFWTKALLWQKDIRLKGYYSFEYLISGNDYIFPPTVVYPDSITRLYQRPER